MTFTFRPQAQIDKEKLHEELRTEERELQEYLNSTDWYVARWGETQKPIPEDVVLKREQTRTRINEIRQLLL